MKTNAIRRLRIKRGFSSTGAAKRLGMCRTRLSKLEHGVLKPRDIEFLRMSVLYVAPVWELKDNWQPRKKRG